MVGLIAAGSGLGRPDVFGDEGWGSALANETPVGGVGVGRKHGVVASFLTQQRIRHGFQVLVQVL